MDDKLSNELEKPFSKNASNTDILASLTRWSQLMVASSQNPFNTGRPVAPPPHNPVRPILPNTGSPSITIKNPWQRIRHASVNPDFTNHDFVDCFSILSPRLCASGVLIAPNAVLTVNHFRKSSLHKSNFWEVTNSINISNKVKLVCKPITPALKVLDEDLEILITEKPVEKDVLPVTFASTQEINQAKKGLIVGYGNDQNGVCGVKRELTVDVELCSANNNYFLFNCTGKRHLIIKAPATFQVGPNRIETDGINPRDSGCPLYINCRGKVKLAGIATRSLDGGKAGLFIRVDTYKNEIDKILARFKA